MQLLIDVGNYQFEKKEPNAKLEESLIVDKDNKNKLKIKTKKLNNQNKMKTLKNENFKL